MTEFIFNFVLTDNFDEIIYLKIYRESEMSLK